MRLGGPALLAHCVVVCLILPMGREARERGRPRHVRETTYWLDIALLVDRSLYQSWYDRTQTWLASSSRKTEAENNIKTYFTLMMKEVSDLYSGVGSVRLIFRPVKFYIDSQGTYQWTVMNSGVADAEQTLANIKTWLRVNTNHSEYDHAVLFTGEDLATDGEGHTTGRGTTGSVCKVSSYGSVSVVEDKGAFQSVFTVAHELGHGLNAVHDGDSNHCSGMDRYIMAANNSAAINDVNRRHPWYFSSCSKETIVSFMSRMSQTEKSTCLERQEPQDPGVPDVTHLIPGQLYGSNVQCQHLYGKQSSYCFFGNLSRICTEMSCSDPSQAGQSSCYSHKAATGTSCGNKKWCQLGQCVSSADAPAVDSCVKDQTGVLVKNMRCDEMAQREPVFCYDSNVYSSCCSSCQNAASGAQGCPYGDRKSGCHSDICHKILHNGDIVDHDCCGTCHFSSTWSCRDVDPIDGTTCDLALKRNNGQGCYNYTLAFHCCATCHRLRQLDSSSAGCEYGDRLLHGCPVSSTPGGECDAQLCCHTCGNRTTSSRTVSQSCHTCGNRTTSSRTVSQSSHSSLPLLLSVLLLSLLPPVLTHTLGCGGGFKEGEN